MTRPSSTPRGEHAGRPGARWETQLVGVERVVEDGEPEPRPNRAARRALKAAGRGRGNAYGPERPEKAPGGAVEGRTPAAGPFSRPGSREGVRGANPGVAGLGPALDAFAHTTTGDFELAPPTPDEEPTA